MLFGSEEIESTQGCCNRRWAGSTLAGDDWGGPAQVEALREIHTFMPEESHGRLVLDAFGDGLEIVDAGAVE
jgi:hypothetical protein